MTNFIIGALAQDSLVVTGLRVVCVSKLIDWKNSIVQIVNGRPTRGVSRGAIHWNIWQMVDEDNRVVDASPITRMQNLEGPGESLFIATVMKSKSLKPTYQMGKRGIS